MSNRSSLAPAENGSERDDSRVSGEGNRALDVLELTRQTEECLRNLDSDALCEYLEALTTVPHLVAQESQTIHFLITSNFDPESAARRLALYWKVRKEIFGEERWLLPMTQTGRGTLSSYEVEILRTRFMAVTPRAVFMADIARLPVEAGMFHPQVIFYMVSVSAPVACTGSCILQIIRSGDRPPPEISPVTVQRMNAALPYRIDDFVIAQTYEPGREHLLDYYSYAQRRVAEINFRRPANCLVGDSLRNTLRRLQERGLQRSCVPTSLGGDFCIEEEFDAWVRTRLSIEDGMGSAPPIRNTETAASAAAAFQEQCLQENTTAFHTTVAATSPATATTNSIATTTTTTTTTTTAATKTTITETNGPLLGRVGTPATSMDRSHRTPVVVQPSISAPSPPRRKKPDTYQRRNVQLVELKQQARDLQAENENLRDEIRRLEHALAHARYVVAIENSKTSQPGKMTNQTPMK